MLKAGGSTYATWPDAVGTVGALERLTPVDFEAFESALADSGLRILSNRDGSPAQIGRSI
ncbi:hypothetical protein [Sinorhizobium meliloti]